MIFGSKIPPKIMALFPEGSGYKFVMIFGSKIPPNLSAFILNKGRRQGFFPTTSSHLKALPSFPFIQLSHPPPLRYNYLQKTTPKPIFTRDTSYKPVYPAVYPFAKNYSHYLLSQIYITCKKLLPNQYLQGIHHTNL